MREILFRGKRKGNGEWVYGVFLKKTIGCIPVIIESAEMNDDCTVDFDYCHVDPETVGQFTGLCDKKGRKIFEGDILRYRKNTAVVKAEIHNCSCCHAVYGFSTEDTMVDISSESMVEVIGNIHDNPELLGVE